MIVLSTENLSLSFGTAPVLSGISFSADESDRIGVIGAIHHHSFLDREYTFQAYFG